MRMIKRCDPGPAREHTGCGAPQSRRLTMGINDVNVELLYRSTKAPDALSETREFRRARSRQVNHVYPGFLVLPKHAGGFFRTEIEWIWCDSPMCESIPIDIAGERQQTILCSAESQMANDGENVKRSGHGRAAYPISVSAFLTASAWFTSIQAELCRNAAMCSPVARRADTS